MSIKVEAKKKYVTRDGHVVFIVKTSTLHNQNKGVIVKQPPVESNTTHIWKLGVDNTWSDDGTFITTGTYSEKDFVKEYDEGEELMLKFNKEYVLVFRYTPLESFHYENFDDIKDLNKKYRNVLRRSSNFKLFKKVEGVKYKMITSKKSMVETMISEFKDAIANNPDSTKVYSFLRKYNDLFIKRHSNGNS